MIKSNHKTRFIALVCLGSQICTPVASGAAGESERFNDVEIRVIRPRYFNKAGRFELGVALSSIMNETFIYTFMASGLLSYHFTEYIGLELGGGIGYNVDKEDKRLLFDEFKIQTKIFRTTYNAGAAVTLTPLYGKWQLPSGRMVYFDTLFALGGGLTGVHWQFSDFCPNDTGTALPADVVKSYPTIMGALGQRYFVTKDISYRWDLRTHTVLYNRLDSECEPEKSTETGTAPHYSITLSLGASKYF